MNTATTVRFNVTLPATTVAKLKQRVPPRATSRFISEAIAEKIAREQREEAWEQFLQLPPTLTEINDPVQWEDELRAQEEERLARLGL